MVFKCVNIADSNGGVKIFIAQVVSELKYVWILTKRFAATLAAAATFEMHYFFTFSQKTTSYNESVIALQIIWYRDGNILGRKSKHCWRPASHYEKLLRN